MVKGKILGLTIGGITGYLIVSRGFSFLQNCVAYVTDAAKWRAYYKYGVKYEEGEDRVQCVVPPGYSSCTRDVGGGKELVVEDPKQKQPEIAENKDASQSDWKASLADALTRAINDMLKGEKGQEEASEGKETASEDGESDEDAVEPSDEDGESDEDAVEEDILCPEEFDKAPGDPEPLYHDDLEDGVKVTYETVDQVFEDFNEKPTSGRYPWGKEKKTEKETDEDETLD